MIGSLTILPFPGGATVAPSVPADVKLPVPSELPVITDHIHETPQCEADSELQCDSTTAYSTYVPRTDDLCHQDLKLVSMLALVASVLFISLVLAKI